MANTIQVRDETRRLLDRLKGEGLASYVEVINRLVRSKVGFHRSIFGACRGSHLLQGGLSSQ